MEKILLIPLILVSSAAAQTTVNGGRNYTGFQDFHLGELRAPEKTVSTLPTASASLGMIFLVTDGTSSSDCTSGGGSTLVNACRSNGTSWVYIGGSGGVTPEPSNQVLAGPTSGASAAPSFRGLVAADLPATIVSSTTGNAATATALAATPSQCAGGQVATGIASSGNANCTSAGTGGLGSAAAQAITASGGSANLAFSATVNKNTISISSPTNFVLPNLSGNPSGIYILQITNTPAATTTWTGGLNSNVITVASATGITSSPTQAVVGTGFTVNTTVVGVSGTSITLSAPPTATSGTVSFLTTSITYSGASNEGLPITIDATSASASTNIFFDNTNGIYTFLGASSLTSTVRPGNGQSTCGSLVGQPIPCTATAFGNAATAVSVAGSGSAQTLTFTPALGALANGTEVRWTPSTANTSTTPVVTVGATTCTVVKYGGTSTVALAVNDWTTNAIARIIYNASSGYCELQNPQTAAGGGGSLPTQEGACGNAGASLPGTPTTNQIYKCTDGAHWGVYDGSSWHWNWGGFSELALPSTTGYSLVSESVAATYGYAGSQVTLAGTASSSTTSELNALVRSVPSTPYTFYACGSAPLMTAINSYTQPGWGIQWLNGNTNSANVVSVGFFNNSGNWTGDQWTAEQSGFSMNGGADSGSWGTTTIKTYIAGARTQSLCIGIDDNGTTRKAAILLSGSVTQSANWTVISTGTHASYITPTYLGIWENTYLANSQIQVNFFGFGTIASAVF